MNWVDRKFAREETLALQAPDRWNDVCAAIHDTVTSFKARYPHVAQLSKTNQNGHRVLLEAKFSMVNDSQGGRHMASKHIAIEFDESKRQITVTVDGGGPKIFHIKADEFRTYLEYQGHEVSADQLAEESLKTALFKPPSRPGFTYSPATAGDLSWME